MHLTTPKDRRLEHFIDGDLPTQTEIRAYMGSSLARIFNDYSHETVRELVGVTPPLKGPINDDLWISPSDQLIEKVALKPPLTNKYTKACTHRGILEIGARTVSKFEEETERKIRQKLDKELKEMRKMFEAEKRRAIELSVQEIRNEYETRINDLNEDFQKKLKIELERAIGDSKKEIRKAVLQERRNVEMEMMKKVRDEVARVVVDLHDEFQQSLRAQRDNMVADFNSIMRRERRKTDERIQSYELKSEEEAIARRREFYAQEIADIAIVVCTERTRCRNEIHTMRQCFEKQIEILLKSSFKSSETIGIQATKENKTERATSRKEVRQNESPRPLELIDRDGKLWRPVLLEPEFSYPGCTDRETNFPIVSSEINFFPPDSYTDRVSRSSTPSLGSKDSLPFCYYDGKLYVRSDYREKDVEREEKKEEANGTVKVTGNEGFVAELKRSESCCRK